MKLIDIMSSPWAIRPEKLKIIIDVYNSYLNGPKLDLKDMESKIDAFSVVPQSDKSYEIIDGSAIIPIKGVLMKNASAFSRIFYSARSTVEIKRIFLEAIEDAKVRSIVLDIDSPGGSVDGTQELAMTIFQNRGIKPITSFTDGMIASAAYWIASAADNIYISGDTVEVGSIGVITTHFDYSEMDKEMGLNITEIFAGKYKAVGSDNKPLSKEDKEYIQSQIDFLYSVFISDVAKFKNVGTDIVLNDMADGRIFIGSQAIKAGLVDGVSSMDQLVKENQTFVNIPYGGKVDSYKIDNNDNAKEDFMVTIESLEKDYPSIFEAVKKLGADEAENQIERKLNEARVEGANTEIERIKSVKEQVIFGHEDLVNSFMFDGKTTGEQAAVAVLKAERENREKLHTEFINDGPEPVVVSEPVSQPLPSNGSKEGDDNRPIEEKAKDTWSKDAGLRKEFNNNFDAYFAFEKASNDGRVRISGGAK